MQINFRGAGILILVAFVHYYFLFYTRVKRQVQLKPAVEKENKKTESLSHSIRVNIKKRSKKHAHSNKIQKTQSLSFESLRGNVDTKLLFAFKGEQGSKVRCLDEILDKIGTFPRSFYHKKITGSSEIRVQVTQSDVTLSLADDEHWLIGGLLCEQMRERITKLKGNSCLRSLVSKIAFYQFSFRLTLSIGQIDGDEFSVSKKNNFHRKISRMAKNSAWQPLKIISNLGSAVELLESNREKREWDHFQTQLRRLNCQSLRVKM